MSTMISPEDFGAVGDGTTDDTTAFAAALTYGADGQNALYLTPGATYLLSTWTPYSNTGKLVIVGNKAVVKGPSSRVNFLEPDANFEIYDTVFERWQVVIQRLIGASSSFDCVHFQRNECRDLSIAGINIERPIQNFWFTDNYMHDIGILAFRVGDNILAAQDTWAHGRICNNIIRDLVATSSQEVDGILVHGFDIDVCDNDISHLETEDGACRGIYVKLRHSLVARNTISDIHSTGSNTEFVGINAKGAHRGDEDPDHGTHGYGLIIAENNLRDMGVSGELGVGIRMQMSEVKCIGNYCDDTGCAGVAYDDQGNAEDITIQNSTIRFSDDGHSGTVTNSGIAIVGQCQNVRVDGNVVRGARNGLNVYPTIVSRTNGPLKNLEVTGNTFDATVIGIGLRANNDIQGCRLINNLVPAATYGVYQESDTGSISSLYLFGNELSGTGTPFFAIPDTTVWFPVGFGLPTSDPNVDGQPWRDSSAFVKISV